MEFRRICTNYNVQNTILPQSTVASAVNHKLPLIGSGKTLIILTNSCGTDIHRSNIPTNRIEFDMELLRAVYRSTYIHHFVTSLCHTYYQIIGFNKKYNVSMMINSFG